MAKQSWSIAALALLLPFAMAQTVTDLVGTHCAKSKDAAASSALDACMTPYFSVQDNCVTAELATATGQPDGTRCICSFYDAVVPPCFPLICDQEGVSIYVDHYSSCLADNAFPAEPTATQTLGGETTAAPTGTGSGSAASQPTTTSSNGAVPGSREAKGGAIAGLLLVGVLGWWV